MISFIKSKTIYFISSFFFVLFFTIGLISLQNYGQNWDEATHLARGQSFLHFFLTGKKDYSDLPSNYHKSFFNSDVVNNFSFYTGPDRAAHPPASDILAAFSNYIFFQKLNILGDYESYHLYSVLVSSILVGIIVYFTSIYFGRFSGTIAGFSLLLYPFFLSESRFNTKDFPETFFYSLFILCFWLAVRKRKIIWILISSIFFGLGLATKFNIFFAGLTVALWFLFYSTDFIKNKGFFFFWKTYKKIIFSFAFIPLIGLTIFYLSWPFLWTDSLNRIKEVLIFYKDLSDSSLDPRFLALGGFINFYPILWIAITTPIVILIFSLVGFLKLLRNFNPNSIGALLLIWFLIPILRVSIIHSYIYGGIRHIMEYIPAMAILSGIGASYLVQNLKFKMQNYPFGKLRTGNSKFKMFNFRLQLLTFIFELLIILSFVPITIKLISIYPNESVYFNAFIGGLKGAKEKNIPGWGNTLGSTYRQGVNWLNKYAEKDSRLALLFELRSNIPLAILRSDIFLATVNRTGMQRKGEYIIGVTHEGFFKDFYNYKYTERFLIPVWELNVDGVPILKIWKNDLQHSRKDYLNEEEEVKQPVVNTGNGFLTLNFEKVIKLTKIEIDYDSRNCVFPGEAFVQVSADRYHWITLPGTLDDFIPTAGWFNIMPEKGKFAYVFAADEVSSVRIPNNKENSCFFSNSIKVKSWHIRR